MDQPGALLLVQAAEEEGGVRGARGTLEPAPLRVEGASGQIVLTTNAGVYFSENTGKTWKAGRVAGGGVPQGGFSYVGMTDATQGVAIPSDEGIGAIYVTGNGGRTWARSPITG